MMIRAPLMAASALLGFSLLVAGGLGVRPWRQTRPPEQAPDASRPESAVPLRPPVGSVPSIDSMRADSSEAGSVMRAQPDTAESSGHAPEGFLEEPFERLDSLPVHPPAFDSI